MPTLVEEAREQAKGASVSGKKSWNTVKVGKKSIIVEKQLPSPSQKNVLAADIRTSSVSQKAPHKHKCDLCNAWYELSSIKYKVPNYRLLELRRSWGIHQTGRRYETASYLYANALVCTFCTQFFDEAYHKTAVDNLEADVVPISPIVTTQLERTDLTQPYRRTYQSSCVDNLESDGAITPPYTMGSKTRREVDPWWELSLEDSYHIHSISVAVMGGIQKALSLHVMVFDASVGWEDPFIESAKGRSKASKEFIMPMKPSATKEDFLWNLPSQTFGTVVRVQLQGVQPLHIKRVQIFQGDDVAAAVSEGTYDGEFAHPGAYATLSLDMIKTTLAFSPMRPRKTLKEINRERVGHSPKKDVHDLFAIADQKARARKDWITAAKNSAMWFDEDELLSIREHIFDDIAKGTEGSTFVTERSRPGSRSRRGDDDDHYTSPFTHKDLVTSCLNMDEPRIDLGDVHHKMRQIMVQIDLKSNLKKLGAIGTSERFEFVAEDDELQLRRLHMSFDFIAESWDRIDARRVLESERAKSKIVQGVQNSAPDVFPVERGCTWAQLCVILHMLCIKRPRLIPARAFQETNFRGNDFFDPTLTAFDDDSPKKKKPGSIDGNDDGSASQSELNMSAYELGDISTDLDGGSAATEYPLGTEKINAKLTLLGTVRSNSTLPVLNTQFSEYKLSNLRNKVAKYPTFPKKLTADFGKLFATPKTALVTTDGGPKVDYDEELAKLTRRKKEPVTVEFDPEEIKSLTSPFPDNKPDPSKFYSNRKKGTFFRICSLCNRKFPKKSIRHFVILKHIITLRRSWDPALIPKKMAMLEEGMGMYNLVPVCAYCCQFFDPDFEGGIAYPQGEDSKDELVLGDKIAEGGTGINNVKVGFDVRFPVKAEVVTEIFTDERALKSRAGARRVREITQSLEVKDEAEGDAAEG
jgi:hypothetical protein